MKSIRKEFKKNNEKSIIYFYEDKSRMGTNDYSIRIYDESRKNEYVSKECQFISKVFSVPACSNIIGELPRRERRGF